mgnify:CR=1 FL=1
MNELNTFLKDPEITHTLDNATIVKLAVIVFILMIINKLINVVL